MPLVIHITIRTFNRLINNIETDTMMKRYASLAILMVALTFAVSCNKENRYKGPSTLPKEKVSRIYKTSHTLTESYNSMTGTTKSIEATNERKVVFEFTWDGDRITRMKYHDDEYAFSYDEFGRIILADCVNEEQDSFQYSYNDDGLLSHSVSYSDIQRSNTDYTWANGHLQKYVMEYVSESGETVYESSEYTWNGDNLSSTVRSHQSADGTSNSVRYDYEYTSIPNPFKDYVYCSAAYTGLIWELDGADGLVNNMYSRVNTDKSVFSFEYTTSGGRLQTVTKSQVSESGNSILTVRVTTDSYYEIEYLD